MPGSSTSGVATGGVETIEVTSEMLQDTSESGNSNKDYVKLLEKALCEAYKAQENVTKALAEVKEQLKQQEKSKNPKVTEAEDNASDDDVEVCCKRPRQSRRPCKDRARDRSRSRGQSRGRSRGHSRGHSRGRSRSRSRSQSKTRHSPSGHGPCQHHLPFHGLHMPADCRGAFPGPAQRGRFMGNPRGRFSGRGHGHFGHHFGHIGFPLGRHFGAGRGRCSRPQPTATADQNENNVIVLF